MKTDTEKPNIAQQQKGKPKKSPQRSHTYTELMMLLPALIILAGLTIFPFIYLIYMGLIKFSTNPSIPSRFVGLSNWSAMFSDANVLSSWIVTLKYFAGALIGQLFLGVGVALLLDRFRKMRGLITGLAISPMFLAPVLTGLLWRFLLHESYGAYSHILLGLGLLKRGTILGDPKIALFSIIIMDIWEWSPLITLIALAGLSTIPQQLYEASALDGASYFQQMKFIMLPMLRRPILIAILIRTMDLVRFFDKIMITTRGGPADKTKILAVRIFENSFRFFKMGYGAVLGFSLLIFTILLSRVFVSFFIKREDGL